MLQAPPLIVAAMQAPDGSVVALVAITSIIFLALAGLITFMARAWDTRLILLGLLSAVAAVLLSLHEVEGVQTTVSLPGGMSQRAGVSLGGGLAGGLMRIAVIFILAGVTAALWSRCCPPAVPPAREDLPRVP